MSSLIDRMIATGYEFIDLSNKTMESCRRKEKKVLSDSRFAISFFISRATEGFESFLLLLRNNRLADSVVLFRSFCEMGINTDYIFTDPKTKPIRAKKYLLNESYERINILTKNEAEFRTNGYTVEVRLKELTARLEEMKEQLSKEFNEKDWRWPRLNTRVTESKNEVIKKIYNQAYAYTSNIEHHDMYFGRDYIDLNECEPARTVEPNPLLRPEINLVMFRSILLVIMKTFNSEYSLEWGKALTDLEAKHDQEYREMPKRPW